MLAKLPGPDNATAWPGEHPVRPRVIWAPPQFADSSAPPLLALAKLFRPRRQSVTPIGHRLRSRYLAWWRRGFPDYRFPRGRPEFLTGDHARQRGSQMPKGWGKQGTKPGGEASVVAGSGGGEAHAPPERRRSPPPPPFCMFGGKKKTKRINAMKVLGESDSSQSHLPSFLPEKSGM